jgi:3-deoxy-D-manno-octulosonic-acid transferase
VRLRNRLIYGAAVYALVPLMALVMLWRGVRERGYWRDFAQRFGAGRTLERRSIWVHAVSVGEVQASAALMHELLARYPETPLVLTTATPAGAARARVLFGDKVEVRFVPFDLPGAARRFCAHMRPRLALIMETELWPNLFHECRVRGVPLVLASARLSARSVGRYRRWHGLFADTLGEGVIVAAQTPADAERFRAVGAPAERTHVTGNIKFDVTVAPEVRIKGNEIREVLGAGRSVWVAGSTHAREEEILLAAHSELGRHLPHALLVLAPRHPPRFEEVASSLERAGVTFIRASQRTRSGADTRVLLLDSVGELVNYYAAGDVAFVGGTLVPIGGHNPLEPAAIGMPLLCGPHYANSQEASELLIECGALQVVRDAEELAGRLASLFADPGDRERLAQAARATIERNRGALERLMALIEPLLASA